MTDFPEKVESPQAAFLKELLTKRSDAQIIAAEARDNASLETIDGPKEGWVRG